MVDPLFAVEQVAHLIYLKILDEESASEGKQDGSRDVFPLQAKRFRWTYWIDKSGEDLIEFVRNQVFFYLSTVVREEEQAAKYFRSAKFEIEDPNLVSSLISELNSVEFRKLEPKISGSLLEQLLANLVDSERSKSTVSLLSRSLIELVVELAEPKPNESIFDPSCQTAEILTGAIQHMNERFGRLCSSLHLAGEHNSNQMHHIATVNLMLHGIRYPDLKLTDNLPERNTIGATESLRKYDIVLTRLPFEPEPVRTKTHTSFSRSTSQSDVFALTTLIESLVNGGRCVAIVRDQLLSSRFKYLRNIRSRLVLECEIQAVISLPANYSIGNQEPKSSILVFRRAPHSLDYSPDTQSKDHVWFYEMHDIGESEQMVATWHSYRSSKFRDPPGFNGDEILDVDISDLSSWWISHTVLEENQFSLVASDYKPFIWKNETAENPIELVENAIRTEREIELGLKRLLNELKSEEL